MSKPAISVECLSKAYRIGLKEEIPDTLVAAMTGWLKSPWRNFQRLRRLEVGGKSVHGQGNGGVSAESDLMWALRDVSFDVQEGEVIGIIGRNGAGKSTLLKVLSRITEPTSGRAVIRGRVGSLLEVGTGFHPELSGRENIYMNGTVLGMKKREIDRRFDEIVDFSGVEKFLDTPVKRYSSGMQVRLAFAVAAHLDPEILIVDEVLAVGDAEFQNKCIGKMRDVARGGRTVLFVSHNLLAIQSLCSRATLIRNGALVQTGAPEDVMRGYQAEFGARQRRCADLTSHPGRASSSIPTLTRGGIVDDNGSWRRSVRSGERFAIRLAYDSARPLMPHLGLVLKSSLGIPVFWTSNRTSQRLAAGRPTPEGISECHFPALYLTPDFYSVDLFFGDSRGDIDIIHDALTLEVEPADVLGTGKLPPRSAGPLFIEARWEYHPLEGVESHS